MLVDISRIKVNDRIRKDFGNIQELADDIHANGLINPPVVTPDFELIAGERRLRACKLLGMNAIAVNVMTVRDYEHQLRIEISENENRKEFTFSERVAWARELERIESQKAKERMSLGGQGSQISDTLRTDDAVAKDAGFGSRDTYRKAKFISDNADEETIRQLDEGEISVNKAYQELKQRAEEAERRAEQAEREAKKAKEELAATEADAASIIERDRKLREENERLKREKNPEPQIVQVEVESPELMRKNQEMNTKIAQLSGEMDTIRRDYERRLRDVKDGDVKSNRRELNRLLGEQLRSISWNHSSALFVYQRISGDPDATRAVRQFIQDYEEAIRSQLEDWHNTISIQGGDATWETI